MPTLRLLVAAAALCFSHVALRGQTESAPAPTTAASRPASSGPFGLLLYGKQLDDAVKKKLLTETFPVTYYRPAPIFLDKFAKTGEAPDCDLGVSLGLRLVLVVRSNGSSYTATNPPKDIEEYKKALGGVLEKYKDSNALEQYYHCAQCQISEQPGHQFLSTGSGDVNPCESRGELSE